MTPEVSRDRVPIGGQHSVSRRGSTGGTALGLGMVRSPSPPWLGTYGKYLAKVLRDGARNARALCL
jgi:hypothetical protein